MSNIKGYFDPNLYSEMQPEAARSSSNAMSSLAEDPELSFPSSQSNYFISSNNSQMSGFVSDLTFYHATQAGGYASNSEGGPSSGGFIYANDSSPNEPHHHFMSPNGTFTTTPSPTSSISSCSIHKNFGASGGGGTPMYSVGSSDYPAYTEYPRRSECALERGVSNYNVKREYYGESNNPSTSSASSSHSAVSLKTQGNSASFVGNNNHHHHQSHRHFSGYNLHRNGNGLTGSAASNKNRNKELVQDDVAGNKKATSPYVKRTSRGEKVKKRCSNCYAINSPSWRRSIAKHSKGDLLCNACGLYEKTAKKKRMLVTADDGNTKVVRKRDARDYCCSTCGAKDVTRWRRLHDTVQCEKCARGQRSHK